MNVYTITVAFCPAAQLARTLLEYDRYRYITPKRHIIVDAHYPINRKNNERDIKLICETYAAKGRNGEDSRVELWDSESDLGSAQTQNWVLQQLDITVDDVFINLDPDASCRTVGWDLAMMQVLKASTQCFLVSCNGPMVQDFIAKRHQEMIETNVATHPILIPDIPTPFNLSMWRYSFIQALGGIPQLFPYYGEVEGPVFHKTRLLGGYNAYMKNCVEDEKGKLMHDQAFEDWKESHARKTEFMGNFREYCLTKGIINESAD